MLSLMVDCVGTLRPSLNSGLALPTLRLLTVAATVKQQNGKWIAEQGAFYRTQRRMFEGQVLVRASRVPWMVEKESRKRKIA